jgi:hypothetical protein
MLMGKIRRDSRTVETTVREALAHLKHYGAPSKRLAAASPT